MGLDITVEKLVRSRDANEECTFYTFNESHIKKLVDSGLEEFISEKENEYYDFVKFFNNENYTDEWEWSMSFYKNGRNVQAWIWKGHPLYPLYNKSRDCITNPEELVVTDEEKQLLVEYNYAPSVDKLKILNKNNHGKNSIGDLFIFLDEIVSREFFDDDIPTYKQTDKGIYTKETCGYQRRGLNQEFYKSFKIDDYFVYKLSELEMIRDKYTDDKESAENFQRNIIDNFTEGEDVVTFDW